METVHLIPKKKTPERKCVGCNGRFPKKDLVRVLRLPDETIVLDKTGKQSGRGAYLCSAECLKKAVRSKRLKNALYCEIPESVLSALEEEFARNE